MRTCLVEMQIFRVHFVIAISKEDSILKIKVCHAHHQPARESVIIHAHVYQTVRTLFCNQKKTIRRKFLKLMFENNEKDSKVALVFGRPMLSLLVVLPLCC